MQSQIRSDSRRETRYEISGGQPAQLTLEPADYRCEPQVVEARLVNLSENGARLSVPVELPLSTSLRMQLNVKELAVVFYLTAEVCWSTPCGDAGWEVGCCLAPRIPPALFNILAEGGRLNRRRKARHEDGRELTAIRAAGGKKQTVTLRDHSEGGFCISAPSPGTPGEQIQICVDSPKRGKIEAKIQWQMSLENRYLLGCTFLHQVDAERLLQTGA